MKSGKTLSRRKNKMLTVKKVRKFIVDIAKRTGVPSHVVSQKILHCLDITTLPPRGTLNITYCELEYIVHRHIV